MAKMVGLGVLQRGRPGLLPDPRRLRLLQGVRDRAGYYREAAFMLIGEGTSDIQKMIIGRSLLKTYALKS